MELGGTNPSPAIPPRRAKPRGAGTIITERTQARSALPRGAKPTGATTSRRNKPKPTPSRSNGTNPSSIGQPIGVSPGLVLLSLFEGLANRAVENLERQDLG